MIETGPMSWSSSIFQPATKAARRCLKWGTNRREDLHAAHRRGGIGSLDDIRNLLNAGCDKVSINSAACRNPELVRQAADRFGSQCIVVNIDPKRVDDEQGWRWEVFTHGGRKPTGLEAVSWAKEVERLGAGEIVPDQHGSGWNELGLQPGVDPGCSEAVSIPVVASGGCGEPFAYGTSHPSGRADAVLAASIFHFGIYSISETKRFLQQNGVSVRLEP